MASCDWSKIKTAGEAKAKLRHSAADERAKTNHTNKDIDTSKTYLNLSFGALSKYDEVRKAYDERLAWLDEQPGANRRKDRVTLVGLYIPAPAGMDDYTARGWFVDAYEIICDELGDDNVLGGSAQFDETHEYTDAETKKKRMSRAHLHAYAVPEKDGKLNAKAVTSRSAMIRMNNRIEEMTRQRYPEYQFMDGSKKKSRKSVEQLKQESDKVAVVQEAKEKAVEIIQQAQEQSAKLIEEARARADKLDGEASDKLWKAEEDREAARQMKADAEEEIAADREALEADRDDFDRERQEFMLERKKWREKANNEVREAIQRETAKLLKTFKAETAPLVKGYEEAKANYEAAANSAAVVAKGFSLETLEAYSKKLRESMKQECEKVRYKGGKTLWDIAGRNITEALSFALMVQKGMTAPDCKYRAEKAAEEAKATIERTPTVKDVMRRLPTLPSGYGKDKGNDGPSLG